MNSDHVTTDIPLPARKAPVKDAPAQGPSPNSQGFGGGPRSPGSPRPNLTVGAYFSEGRNLVDARRGHLARVGMTPEHVEALRMPDPAERPQPVHVATTPHGLQVPAIQAPAEPEVPPREGGYEPRKLPKLPGVNARIEE